MPDLYDINIDTGELTRVLDTGEVISTTIDDLSGGRLTILGTTIRDTLTGRIVNNLARTRTNVLEQLGEGVLLLQRPKSLEDINSAISANGMDAISFGYNVELPDGTIVSEVVDQVSVTPIEGVVIVRAGEQGKLEFRTIVPQLDTLTGQILNLPEGYRLATPDEATRRAVSGYLMNALRDQMETIAAAHIFDENGELIGSAYEAAAFIARTGIFNLVGLQLAQV